MKHSTRDQIASACIALAAVGLAYLLKIAAGVPVDTTLLAFVVFLLMQER